MASHVSFNMEHTVERPMRMLKESDTYIEMCRSDCSFLDVPTKPLHGERYFLACELPVARYLNVTANLSAGPISALSELRYCR